MKKAWVSLSCFMFLVLILLNVVSGISSDLKAEYERGETIITEISGNILEPIDASQVDFRRGHVSVPFEYDLKKLGERYFVWAIAPDNVENYTLVIEEVATTVSGKTTKIDFSQDFSVKGNLTDYSLNPGFVYTLGDFSINIQVNEDFDKSISVDFPEEREIVLRPGDNKIDFSVLSSEVGFRKINIGKYVVPFFLADKGNVSLEEREVTLRLNPIGITSTILVGEKIEYPITIVNFGSKKISDIEINYDKEIFNISGIEKGIEIPPITAYSFNISMIKDLNETDNINEFIYVNSGDFSLGLPLNITYTKNVSNVETPYLEEEKVLYYCSELSGLTCTGGDICEGVEQQSKDGVCCVGKCVVEEPGSLAWIGYTIGGILVIVLIFIFVRYRKARKKREGFKKRVKEAEQNLSRAEKP